MAATGRHHMYGYATVKQKGFVCTTKIMEANLETNLTGCPGKLFG